MIKNILKELKEHAPFTFLGAFSGIIIFFLLKNIPNSISYKLFYTFHPLHVFLSAFVTAAMFKIHDKKANWIKILIIGFVGSVGIATVSDSIIPYIGETILHLPNREMHLGFIEEWYIVNPIAILGILLAMFIPKTKVPHMGHVFVSTWASLFHVMMSIGGQVGILTYLAILSLLFIAVWVPCCVSDIVFPMLFIKDCPPHCMCCGGNEEVENV